MALTPTLPGYEQQIVSGAGLAVTAGHDKVVLHTTETGPRSLQPLINHWEGNWGAGLPHFIIEGSRVVQLLPLTVNAYTLENHNGGVDTNRCGHVIQVEIVSYAASGWDDATYASVGKWLADLVRAGLDMDVAIHPYFPGPGDGVLASYNSRFRLPEDEYKWYPGYVGHVHVKENAHWDPGKIDSDRLTAIAFSHLGGAGPTPPTQGDWFDMATQAELQAIIDKSAMDQDARTKAYIDKVFADFQVRDVVMQLDNKLFRMIPDDDGNVRRRYITAEEYPGLQESKQVRAGWTNVSMEQEGWFRNLPTIPVIVNGADVTPF